MRDYNRTGISPGQLEHLKLQLTAVMPQLSRAQIFELADLFYEAARARRASAFDEDPHWDISI